MSKTLILSMVLCLFAACSTSQNIDNSTVKDLDQSRYLGGWYEIARFDHRFERGLEECKALYKLCEDGKIDVTNTGVKNGQPKVAQSQDHRQSCIVACLFLWTVLLRLPCHDARL